MLYNEVRGANNEYLFETNHGTLSNQFMDYNDSNICYGNPSATIYVWA